LFLDLALLKYLFFDFMNFYQISKGRVF